MRVARISALLLISFLLLGCERSNGSFVCHFGVPGGDAYAIADIVAKHIKEYYAFADRTTVDRTHSGKIYYVAPGCVPSFNRSKSWAVSFTAVFGYFVLAWIFVEAIGPLR